MLPNVTSPIPSKKERKVHGFTDGSSSRLIIRAMSCSLSKRRFSLVDSISTSDFSLETEVASALLSRFAWEAMLQIEKEVDKSILGVSLYYRACLKRALVGRRRRAVRNKPPSPRTWRSAMFRHAICMPSCSIPPDFTRKQEGRGTCMAAATTNMILALAVVSWNNIIYRRKFT